MISTCICNQNDNMRLKIKPEYAREWGILPPDKYSQLKESIILGGQKNPIIVDKYGNILDGHNRYKILQELGRQPIFEVRDFENDLSALDFIITSNLYVKESNAYVKIMKANKLRHLSDDKAKLNQQLKLLKKDQKGFQPISAQNFAPIGRISKKIAKLAGVSYRTVEKAKKIEISGSQKQIYDLVEGKRSINEVYLEIRSEEEKKHLVNEAKMINSQLSLTDDKAMLLCGDIRDPDILAKIPDEVADISITDPPYEEKYYHYMNPFLQLSKRS
jgi:hypothetical protein